MAISEFSLKSSDQQRDEQGILPELLYSFSALYQIGLAAGADNGVQELYQNILTCLRQVIMADGACLFLYQKERHHFIPGAIQGEKLPYRALIEELDHSDIAGMVAHGPDETIISMSMGALHIVLITLSYNEALLGVVALSYTDDTLLLNTRAPLLAGMCHVTALLLANYELRSAELRAVIDQEHTRIAHDLHDGIAQQLALSLLKLEYIQRLLGTSSPVLLPEQIHTEVQHVYALLKTCLDDLRHGIASLLPPELERHDFASAWPMLLDQYQANHPETVLSCETDDLAHLSVALEAPVYRFLQEALNNIHKHAWATLVKIHARLLGNVLFVEVRDNGVGFEPEQFTREPQAVDGITHMGLRSMRERIQAIGGKWELYSRPGEGTVVFGWFPLAHPTIELTNREREVLRLVASGLTNRQIAERLLISAETVKSHIHHIMQKMQVRDRTQAAEMALHQGLI